MDRRLWAALAAVVLALSLAGVAAAKGGALASLETPIPPDADPGTTIDVAWRAWMPDAGTDWPFSGLPVFIRLISADGGRSTETMGRESPAGSGRYEATIAIPSGGVGRVEVGLFGESCVDGTCTRSDLLFELPEDQRVAAVGGSSPGCAVGDPAAPAGRAGPWPTDTARRGPGSRTCRSRSRSSGPACCCWWRPSG